MEEPRSQIVLANPSFEAFVEFIFDHDVSPKPLGGDYWYSRVDVEFDAESIGAHYLRLFRHQEFLLAQFTKVQIDEGFWAIQSPNLDCSVARIIDDADLPLSLREECIRSMTDLFKRLFATESFDTSVWMWWDSLCYDWHCGNRNRERGGEDLELQDIFFQTLTDVLSIDSQICQKAALHGLGHLHHPETPMLIKRYIESNPSLTEAEKEYASGAAKFDVL